MKGEFDQLIDGMEGRMYPMRGYVVAFMASVTRLTD